MTTRAEDEPWTFYATEEQRREPTYAERIAAQNRKIWDAGFKLNEFQEAIRALDPRNMTHRQQAARLLAVELGIPVKPLRIRPPKTKMERTAEARATRRIQAELKAKSRLKRERDRGGGVTSPTDSEWASMSPEGRASLRKLLRKG